MESAVAEPLTETTCEQLAFEVGDQVDTKMLEIADGADDTNGESRASRSRQWRVVIFQNLNARLRELDIRDECHTDEMLAMMEIRFSDALVERSGDYLNDAVGEDPNETWTYDEWREEVSTDPSIIDGE
jgi:hypothetical protein